MSEPHYVYRCYDASGALLYVGCSRDVGKRMRQHRYYSRWFKDLARTTQEMCATEDDGRAREREVITAECPLFNVTHATVKNRTPDSERIRAAMLEADSYDGFITLNEAAQKYGLAYSTLASQVRKGVIEVCRVGTAIMLTTTVEIERYISEHKGKRGRPRKPKDDTP